MSCIDRIQRLGRLWFQAFNGVNLENVSVSVGRKEAIRNIVVLKKEHSNFFTFGKSLTLQLLPLVFDTWHGATESFILVVLPLNTLMREQTVKLNDLQVSCLMVRYTVAPHCH